jgi:hypothetical protein
MLSSLAATALLWRRGCHRHEGRLAQDRRHSTRRMSIRSHQHGHSAHWGRRSGGYLRGCSNILGHAPLPLPSSGPPAPATWIPPTGGWSGCLGPDSPHREGRAGREGGAAERVPAHAGAQAPWPYPGPACCGHRRHARARIADRARRGRHYQRLARYIEALGGRLDLVASFGDHTFTVATTEVA